MAAADLMVRNGVGVDAEAVLRPLDWQSTLRTRAATRRPLSEGEEAALQPGVTGISYILGLH